MEKVYGKAVSGGQVMGKIILLRRKKINEEDAVRSSEEEIERLKKAVAELERENERLYENALSTIGESGASIFEVYKLMLDDDDFIGEALRIIKEDGVGAVSSVKKRRKAVRYALVNGVGIHEAARGGHKSTHGQAVCRTYGGNEHFRA